MTLMHDRHLVPTSLALPQLHGYWGKADPTAATSGITFHTVLGHSLDVAACAFALLEDNPVLRDRIALMLQIEPETSNATVACVCALHDIGKLDTRFQRKAPEVADALRPHTRGLDLGKYDHGTEGFRQVEDSTELSEQLGRLIGPAAIPLLRAVCGHHGALPTRGEPDPSRSRLPRRLRTEDVRAQAALLNIVVELCQHLGGSLPLQVASSGALVQVVAGLCAICDWLGSNTEFFPYQPPFLDVEAYWIEALDRARLAVRSTGLHRAQTDAKAFGALFPTFAPRDVQILTERIDGSAPALVIVEAEMGRGKTEAALALASRFMRQTGVDGLTIALPTMATSNAMFERVASVLPCLFPRDTVQLSLAHSRARGQDQFRRLLQHTFVPKDADAPEAGVMCTQWLLQKKRVLLSQVGVGTVDQALQAALTVRHQSVRMFALSRNVIVIDEVHAYDAYMEVLLDHLLAWLGALSVPVILLSATLPSARRASLARAWLGTEELDSAVALTHNEASNQAYPLVSVVTQQSTAEHKLESVSRARTVAVEYAAGVDEDGHLETTSARLVRAARAGARVAWIRNTVGEAQDAARSVAAICGDIEYDLFHARYRAADRQIKEARVLERYGKSAPPGGRLLIATQVVEQSLDLDFDELHSDIAPVDLLLQRVGRLHRHDRSRPDGYASPRLVVHGPGRDACDQLRFGPSRYVYDPCTLWLAADDLASRSRLTLPSDIRPMVEGSYHPQARAARLGRAGPELVQEEAALTAKLEATRVRARRCCISPTEADPDGDEVLPDDEDAVQAFTRDGQSTTLILVHWQDGRGGALGGEGAWDLDVGREDAWKLARELLDQTVSVPNQGRIDGVVVGAPDAAWQRWASGFRAFCRAAGLGHRMVPIPMTAHTGGFSGAVRVNASVKRATYSEHEGLRLERAEE